MTMTIAIPGTFPDMNRIIAASKRMIIDELVAGGVLAGDGWNHICAPSDTFHIDTHNSGVMVSIGHDHFPSLKNPLYDVDTGYNCELLEIMCFFRVPCIER